MTGLHTHLLGLAPVLMAHIEHIYLGMPTAEHFQNGLQLHPLDYYLLGKLGLCLVG